MSDGTTEPWIDPHDIHPYPTASERLLSQTGSPRTHLGMSYETPAYKGRSAAFRDAMARSAEKRRCPKCNRKSALSSESDGMYRWRECRWCDYHSEPRLHAWADPEFAPGAAE